MLGDMADDDIADQIEADAQGAKKATGDFGSYEKHSLQDQIAADKYIRGIRAQAAGTGFKLTKFVPPGGRP
jgi:hypothetical protein